MYGKKMSCPFCLVACHTLFRRCVALKAMVNLTEKKEVEKEILFSTSGFTGSGKIKLRSAAVLL
jgi:glutaredoxin